AAGGALGVALAYGLLEILKRFGPPDVRRLHRAVLDGTLLLVTAGTTLITGLLLGLAPAMLAARRALANSLREGGRGSSSTRTNRLRDAFTVAQIALSLVLLVGAGLLVRSFARLITVESGFRTDHVLTMNLSLPGARYRDQKGVQFFAALSRRVRALPGVVNASTITYLPFKGIGSATYFWK